MRLFLGVMLFFWANTIFAQDHKRTLWNSPCALGKCAVLGENSGFFFNIVHDGESNLHIGIITNIEQKIDSKLIFGFLQTDPELENASKAYSLTDGDGSLVPFETDRGALDYKTLIIEYKPKIEKGCLIKNMLTAKELELALYWESNDEFYRRLQVLNLDGFEAAFWETVKMDPELGRAFYKTCL